MRWTSTHVQVDPMDQIQEDITRFGPSESLSYLAGQKHEITVTITIQTERGETFTLAHRPEGILSLLHQSRLPDGSLPSCSHSRPPAGSSLDPARDGTVSNPQATPIKEQQ